MRYPFEAFLVVALITVLTDILLYRHILAQYPQKIKSHFSYPFGPFWFYSLSSFFVVIFAVYWAQVKYATTPETYIQFMWLMVVFLLIYLPKAFYLIGFYVMHMVRYLTARGFKPTRNEKMNNGRYPRITRKKFLSQIGIVIASAPFISLLFGAIKGRFSFVTRYTKLSFPNLPKAFDGLKVVQISDLHLGSLNSNYKEIDKVIDIINAEVPDIICFTGDLVNNFYEETIGWDDVFNRLKATKGIFSVLGNHDYGDYSKWKSIEEKATNLAGIKKAHQRFGFRLLNNESVIIEKAGEQLAFVGVENWGHHPFPRYGDLQKAGEGLQQVPFKILLSHDPDHWDAEIRSKSPFDLTLAGHTHGMQFGLEYKGFQWSPAKYKFRRWSGLYQEGNQFLYVNRGLGYLGIPVRVGMPPEITVIELTKGPIGTEPM